MYLNNNHVRYISPWPSSAYTVQIFNIHLLLQLLMRKTRKDREHRLYTHLVSSGSSTSCSHSRYMECTRRLRGPRRALQLSCSVSILELCAAGMTWLKFRKKEFHVSSKTQTNDYAKSFLLFAFLVWHASCLLTLGSRTLWTPDLLEWFPFQFRLD